MGVRGMQHELLRPQIKALEDGVAYAIRLFLPQRNGIQGNQNHCLGARIGLKKQGGCEKRPVYALGNIMSRAAPKPGIYALRRRYARTRKADATTELGMRKAIYRRFCAHEI